MRFWPSLFALFICVGTAAAGGDGIAGNWKVTIYEDGQYLNFWLLTLQNKDGKLTGSAETLARIPPTTVLNPTISGDMLTMALKLANGVVFNFEGKLPRAGGKKILGAVNRAGNFTPAYLEATQAKNAFELNLEVLTRTPSDPKVFGTVLDLLKEAKSKKTAPRDVQEWLETALRSSEAYGPSWQADYGVRLVDALQADYPALAVETGMKVEKTLDAKGPIDIQLRLLTALSASLKASGQADEAAKMLTRIDQVEGLAFKEYAKSALDFKIAPYTGKGGRPVLVELFTGAQCPPCVAADMAFDALEASFKDTEVVLLQYHMHIPGPDALTNADNEARAEFYARSFRGTPASFFNGKPLAPGGGSRDDAEEKYKEYRGVVETLLKKEADGKLAMKATRKGDVVTLQALAADLAAPGPKLKLRFALVEDWARYKGRNGLAFHHRVVRAMPGGAAGFAIADKTFEKSVTVDVAELRDKINKYLDNYAREEEKFPDAQRPLRLRDLHGVAFIQNDETGEVLNAVSVPVKE